MSFRASLPILEWSVKHKPQLAFISSTGILRYGTSISYGVLPSIIAWSYGEWMAGVVLSLFNFIQALVVDPIAGSLSDRFGSKPVVITGSALIGAAGALWLISPLDNAVALSIFALLLFTGYGFRDEVFAYLLRTSAKEEGGVIFGVAENIFAITTFLSSLSLPYFILTEHHFLAALIMVTTAILSVVMTLGLPSDKRSYRQKESILNPWRVLSRGWHFVKINNYYPALSLGNSIFEGVFYGMIWLVIPLKISTEGGGILAGLALGIYELVTVFMAGYSGYLADHYHWSSVNIWGWVITAAGAVLILLSSGPIWLVCVGAVIALGNNLFAFASSHALEANDIDHREDGKFIGFNNLVTDLGYAISPLVAGGIYYQFGFTASMSFAVAVTLILAAWMIAFTRNKTAGPP